MLTLSDRDAYAHAYRVAALAVSVARALQLRDEAVAALERAALLHDSASWRAGSRAAQAGAADRRGAGCWSAGIRRSARDLIAQRAVSRGGPPSWSRRARADGRPGLSAAARTRPTSRSARGSSAVADAYDAMTRPRVFRDAISSAKRCSSRALRGHAVRPRRRRRLRARCRSSLTRARTLSAHGWMPIRTSLDWRYDSRIDS